LANKTVGQSERFPFRQIDVDYGDAKGNAQKAIGDALNAPKEAVEAAAVASL
jgi:hypothetical protein